jgi:PKD repeat protein
VRVIKLVASSMPASKPAFDLRPPESGSAGKALTFEATAASAEAPVLGYRWDFGDGTSGHGSLVEHTYTHAGTYEVRATSMGLNSSADERTFSVTISGENSTRFDPTKIRHGE